MSFIAAVTCQRPRDIHERGGVQGNVLEWRGDITADVLDIKPIGIETNFFDLGGHSLLATRVVTRIREEFDLSLPLRVFFDSPTIAGIAEHVVNARTSIADVVDKLTQLSEDEIRSMLQETMGQQEF